MKRIKSILLIIMFSFIIGKTISVKADNFNYYLSNSDANYEYVDKNNAKVKSVKRGDTIYVSAIINNKNNVSDYKINSGKLTIRWDDKHVTLQEVNGRYYNDSVSDITGLTIGSVNKGTNKFSINELSSTGFLKNGKNKIVEFKFLVLTDSSADETKIYQMDGEDNLKCITSNEQVVNCGDSLYSELKYKVESSTINKLSNIKINGVDLEYFNEDKNDYDITVESNVEKANIEVTRKDSKSTISGNYGENKLTYGENKFVVNVISESGARNTYYINITREDSRSSVNTLKTLTLSSGEIDFSPNETEYNVIVPNEVDKITITSSLTDPKSKYVEDYQNKEIELVEGSNKVEIKVVSEKGEEKVYTISINRSLSSNNSLKSLKVNDEKIKLEENVFKYDITFENDIEEVVVKAEPNDTKATVTLDEKYPLQVGENEINVVVVAASGEKASYILNVTRKKLLSKDSLLTSLKIKDYDINFKQSVTLYNLKIADDVRKLEITTTQEDPNATVEIEGNDDLENGSIIKINVKAEDGTYTRYFINIEKGSSGISPVIFVIIGLFVLLGLCIGIIIYRKKKKEQAKFDKLDEAKEEAKEEKKLEEDIESSYDEEVVQKDNEIPETTIEVGKHGEIGRHESHGLANNKDDAMPVKNDIDQDKEKDVE